MNSLTLHYPTLCDSDIINNAKITYHSAVSYFQRLMAKYPVLVDHLLEVEFDESYTNKGRNTAEELRSLLLDPNFLVLIIVQIDILSLVSVQSLNLQQRGDTYILEQERHEGFLANIKKVKQKKGENLVKFLKDVKCTDDEDEFNQYLESNGTSELSSCKTLDNYEMSSYRSYMLKPLSDSVSDFSTMSSYINVYIDAILNLHKKLFAKDQDLRKLMKIFSFKTWKKTVPVSETNNVIRLAQLLKIDNAADLRNEWPTFRKSLMKSDWFCKNRENNRPESFWSALLNTKDFKIPPLIRSVLLRVLIVATSSSDAER